MSLQAYLWCTGREYYRASLRSCPHDGCAEPRWPHIASLIAAGEDPSFEALIAAGAEEGELLSLLLLPDSAPDVVPDLEGWPRDSVLRAVEARNALILCAFPDGVLAHALRDPRVPVPFVQSARQADWWVLADPAAHTEGALAFHGLTAKDLRRPQRFASLPAGSRPLMGEGRLLFDPDACGRLDPRFPTVPRGHL